MKTAISKIRSRLYDAKRTLASNRGYEAKIRAKARAEAYRVALRAVLKEVP